jgi:hypothetical protein
MCKFITVVLPRDVDLLKINSILDKYKLSFQIIKNIFIQEQLPNNELYLKATKNYCDCESGLGGFGTIYMKSESVDDLIQLGLKKETLDYLTLENDNKKSKMLKDAEKWLNFINALFKIEKANNIGILLHFYHSNVNDEKFAIKSFFKIHISKVNIEYLTRMEEDILYMIYA